MGMSIDCPEQIKKDLITDTALESKRRLYTETPKNKPGHFILFPNSEDKLNRKHIGTPKFQE